MISQLGVEALIEQLGDARSGKRRAAAKKLRAAGDPSAATALVAALEKEVNDRRTWETQYQMIMALAASRPSAEAVSLLERVLALDIEPMVYLAAGDALVRVNNGADAAVLAALRSGSLPRAEGAIRALAMMRTVPTEATTHAIIGYANEPARRQVRFWVAAAAAGWPKASVRPFLEQCLIDDNADTRRAAQAALKGRYLKWNPL